MKRPLFWKLLIGSWLSLILVAIGNAVVFRTALRDSAPWRQEALQRIQHLQLAVPAKILQADGPEALAAFMRNLPPGEELEVVKGSAPPDDTSGLPRVSQVVRTPSGVYTIVYRSSAWRQLFPRRPAAVNRVPLQLLLVDFIAVSVFTILIARYLAQPIQLLRAGIERVAGGDLTVRVYEQLAHRRDELADLAQNFDLMAARLQQLLQARERLLHDVSHELRSPLTRLSLAVDLTRQRPDRFSESLERIEHETQRLNIMVDELLGLSRAEFNAARSETYFAVADLVAAVTADARFEAQAKGVQVSLETSQPMSDGTGPLIKGSPELLRKGLDNVLRNSVRVSASGQTVKVRLDAPVSPSNRMQVTVSDNGPGVPQEELQRIFEPFVRLDDQRQSSGYGLGLAIAHSATRAHGGSIRASNDPMGGLRVVFELPVEVHCLLE